MGKLLKYQDGGVVNRTLPEVHINGLPKRYLEALEATRKVDSIVNSSEKDWKWKHTDFHIANNGAERYYLKSTSDILNKFSKTVTIPAEWWEEAEEGSGVGYSPSRRLIPVSEAKEFFPTAFNDDYGVDPIGYKYAYGNEGGGTYVPIFNTDLDRYKTYGKLNTRGFKNDAKPGVIIPTPNENTIPNSPIRYRRTWSRDAGQGYEQYVQDSEGNVIESQPISKEEWYKVSQPNRGKTARILKKK